MTDVPFLRRKTQHKIGKPGRASEKRLGKELGARTRPASGAMEGAKGDLDLGEFLVEAKSTINHQIAIKHEWLAKIGKEARSEGKTPALTVSFINEDGSAVMNGEWAMIPMWLFRELTK